MAIYYRGDSNLGDEDTYITNERARRQAGNGQADTRSAGLLHFAPVVRLQHVGHLVAQYKGKLRFILERSEQAGYWTLTAGVFPGTGIFERGAAAFAASRTRRCTSATSSTVRAIDVG